MDVSLMACFNILPSRHYSKFPFFPFCPSPCVVRVYIKHSEIIERVLHKGCKFSLNFVWILLPVLFQGYEPKVPLNPEILKQRHAELQLESEVLTKTVQAVLHDAREEATFLEQLSSHCKKYQERIDVLEEWLDSKPNMEELQTLQKKIKVTRSKLRHLLVDLRDGEEVRKSRFCTLWISYISLGENWELWEWAMSSLLLGYYKCWEHIDKMFWWWDISSHRKGFRKVG